MSDTLTERRRETARFTAFVNDRDAGAWPNERLAVRVAEKNLALAEELHDLLHNLLLAYRSALRSYAQVDAPDVDFIGGDPREADEIRERMTMRGYKVLAQLLPRAPEARADAQSAAESERTTATLADSDSQTETACGAAGGPEGAG